MRFMVGLSLASCLVILALVAEIYYLFWWKKRIGNREMMESLKNLGRDLVYYCWKKPSCSSSSAINPQEIYGSVSLMNGSDESHLHSRTFKDFLVPFGEEEESVEAELMRLHNLSGPPRFLFTIKEETKEDLESEGEKSRKGSRGRSLSDLLSLYPKTPFLSPLSSPAFFTPPLTPIDFYSQHGLNPLYDSSKTENMCIRVRSSPPPKFKFLKDAEEKLYRKSLMEEALKAQRSNSLGENAVKENLTVPSHSPVTAYTHHPSPSDEERGSFITMIVRKNRENGHQQLHHSISPLPAI